MIVAGAKSAQHHAPLVRPAVAVVVSEEQQFRAVADVGTVAHDFQAGRNHQPVGEHRGFIRATIVVRILKDQNLVVGLLARFDLRIDRAADDPQATARVEADLDRLHHAVGFAGKKVHLKAGGELECGLFCGGIVLGGSANEE